MQTANIIEMGQITTIDADGLENGHDIAMAVSFKSRESLHAAVRERVCCFTLFGDGGVVEPNAKIEASQTADRMRLNLDVLRSDAKGYDALFADAQALVTGKQPDDLRNLVKARIDEAQQQEAQRIAAAQERQAQRDAEARRQADAAANTSPPLAKPDPPKQPAATTVATPPQARPSDTEIIVAVARAFGVTGSVARGWLARMDISEAA